MHDNFLSNCLKYCTNYLILFRYRIMPRAMCSYLKFIESDLYRRRNIENAHHFIDSSLFRNSGTSTTLPEIRDESATEPAFRRLSNADRILLESLDIGQYRSRHTGRFLTMHKRRRKKLITRSLNQESGILDDIFHGLVQVTYQN